MKIALLGNHAAFASSETHHAATLESLGHEVIRLQEPQVPAVNIARTDCQLFIWTHSHGWDIPHIDQAIMDLKNRSIPVIAFHLDLFMELPRWNHYQHDPYLRMLDHFFTVDPAMADWLNKNTTVKGHFLPAGVYGPECYISDNPDTTRGNDVIFVGSRGYHESWPYRPQLIDWLRSTYGPRFTHVGGDGDTGTVRGDDLNRIYAGSKVAVGDTLCPNFTYPHYASDRLWEAPGRGAMQIFPRITGLDDWFTDRENIVFYDYRDFDQLKSLIDYYLENDDEREKIRHAGHEYVKANHTYLHRWQTILDTVFA